MDYFLQRPRDDAPNIGDIIVGGKNGCFTNLINMLFNSVQKISPRFLTVVHKILVALNPVGHHRRPQAASLTGTNWNMSDSAAPLIPIICTNMCSKILRSMVSNAALRPSRTSMDEYEALPDAITLASAVSVQ